MEAQRRGIIIIRMGKRETSQSSCHLRYVSKLVAFFSFFFFFAPHLVFCREGCVSAQLCLKVALFSNKTREVENY